MDRAHPPYSWLAILKEARPDDASRLETQWLLSKVSNYTDGTSPFNNAKNGFEPKGGGNVITTPTNVAPESVPSVTCNHTPGAGTSYMHYY
jgi:hypothetical protein